MPTLPPEDYSEDVSGVPDDVAMRPADVRVVEPVRIEEFPAVTVASVAAAIAQATVAVPVVIAPAHPARAAIRIKNTHAANTLFIGPSTMTNTTGYPLAPGESIELRTRSAISASTADGQAGSYALLSQFRDG